MKKEIKTSTWLEIGCVAMVVLAYIANMYTLFEAVVVILLFFILRFLALIVHRLDRKTCIKLDTKEKVEHETKENVKTNGR